jgi:hypothetical protein
VASSESDMVLSSLGEVYGDQRRPDEAGRMMGRRTEPEGSQAMLLPKLQESRNCVASSFNNGILASGRSLLHLSEVKCRSLHIYGTYCDHEER